MIEHRSLPSRLSLASSLFHKCLIFIKKEIRLQRQPFFAQWKQGINKTRSTISKGVLSYIFFDLKDSLQMIHICSFIFNTVSYYLFIYLSIYLSSSIQFIDSSSNACIEKWERNLKKRKFTSEEKNREFTSLEKKIIKIYFVRKKMGISFVKK